MKQLDMEKSAIIEAFKYVLSIHELLLEAKVVKLNIDYSSSQTGIVNPEDKKCVIAARGYKSSPYLKELLVEAMADDRISKTIIEIMKEHSEKRLKDASAALDDIYEMKNRFDEVNKKQNMLLNKKEPFNEWEKGE